MEGAGDITNLVNEFAIILCTGPTLGVLAGLDSLVYDPQFMRTMQSNSDSRRSFLAQILQALPDLGEVINTFLDQMLQLPAVKETHRWSMPCSPTTSPASKDTLGQLRASFYWILVSLTADSEELCIQLTDARVPFTVGKDISQLHTTYQEDETAADIVTNGLAIINNCSLSRCLLPQLRDQVLDTVILFADPHENHTHMVMKSLAVIQHISLANTLHGCYFPEKFFTTLSELVAGLYYDKEFRQYWTRFNDGSDGDRYLTAAGNVLDIMKMLAHAEHYKCRLLAILNERSDQVGELICSPCKQDVSRTRSLVQQLSDHSCGQCGGVASLVFRHSIAPSASILHGLQHLIHEENDRCLLLRYLHTHREEVDKLLSSGHSTIAEEEMVRSAITAVSSHFCSSCGGAFYFLVKHGIEPSPESNSRCGENRSMFFGGMKTDLSRTMSISEPTLAQEDCDDLFWQSDDPFLDYPAFQHDVKVTSDLGYQAKHESVCAEILRTTTPLMHFAKSTLDLGMDHQPLAASLATLNSTDTMESSSAVCPHLLASTRFLKSMDVPVQYIDVHQSVCYCEECIALQGGNTPSTFLAGQPPKAIATPLGWTKHPIRTPVRALTYGILEKWHTCYHGTASENIANILKSEVLLPFGDSERSEENLMLSASDGHTKRKSHALDEEQCLLSPSIIYASTSNHSTKIKFQDGKTGKMWEAQMVLQVHIRPGSYSSSQCPAVTKKQTLDPLFDNSQVAWSTANLKSVIPTAVLVKLHPKDEPRSHKNGDKSATSQKQYKVKSKSKKHTKMPRCPVQ